MNSLDIARTGFNLFTGIALAAVILTVDRLDMPACLAKKCDAIGERWILEHVSLRTQIPISFLGAKRWR
jgi:hypothetical protein